MVKKLLLTIVIFCAGITQVSASTIWCNPANTGTETGISKAAGYNTLWEALAAMSAGDTIIIADGNWSGYSGMTIDSSGHLPVSGTSYSNMSSIVAETDFGAQIANILDNGTGRQFVRIQGVVVKNHFAFFYGWSHAKIIRCGFMGAKEAGNVATLSASNCEYMLFEECIAWGGGRYKFIDYQGNNNIFRRCVARHDWYISPEWQGQESNFRGYDCINSSWQNCISIDSNREEYQTSCATYGGTACEDADFWVGEGNGEAEGNTVSGCIVVNGLYQGYYFGGPDTVETVELTNSVAILTSNKIYGLAGLTGAVTSGTVDTTISNCFFYGYNTTNQHGIYHNKESGTISVIDTVFAYTGAVSGYSEDDVLYNNVTGQSNDNIDFMEYPVRVESGSIGPTILKQIGTQGTCKDETGWDTVTSEDLWPFPNESIIKTLMSETVDGVEGEYGFCAGTSIDGTPQTLTKYIWEQLGNEIPSEVYGEPSYDPPTIAVSDTNTGTSSSGTITGTATKDEALSFGLCTWSHSSGSVTGFATVLLGVVSGTVTGLPVGTTSVHFSLLDSEGVEATDDPNFIRSVPAASGVTSTAVSHGVVRY